MTKDKMNHYTFITLKALGHPHVRSYDRSWSEWGPDPNLTELDAQGRPVLVSAPTHEDDHDDDDPAKPAPRGQAPGKESKGEPGKLLAR